QGKDRIDGNSTHSDFLRRYTQRLEIDTRFVDGHEIALVVVDQPHSVHVEVSNNDHLPAGETFFGFEPRNDLCGQEMSTDNQVRLVLRQQLYEGSSVELIEREPAAFVLPGLVELVIKPTRRLGKFIDEIDIRL